MLRGLKFILYSSLFKDETLGIEQVFKIENSEFSALLYVPQKEEKGLIVSLSGFSVNGFRDKRIAVINNTFKRLGYRVITPQLKTIDKLLIHPKAIDELKDVLTFLLSDPNLNPKGFRLAIFAPSFTAGIAALALAEMPKNTAYSFCFLGGFTDFETTIQFAMSNPNQADDYGMHILLKNFLRYEVGENEELEKLVQTAIEDNGFRRKVPQLKDVLSSVNQENKQLYLKLISDANYRRKLILSALRKIPDFERWKSRLDLAQHAHKISCKVSIIHGAGDEVIPPSQSVLFHSILKQTNAEVRLELTHLLDHGDVKISYRIVSQVIKLARAFEFFLP